MKTPHMRHHYRHLVAYNKYANLHEKNTSIKALTVILGTSKV